MKRDFINSDENVKLHTYNVLLRWRWNYNSLHLVSADQLLMESEKVTEASIHGHLRLSQVFQVCLQQRDWQSLSLQQTRCSLQTTDYQHCNCNWLYTTVIGLDWAVFYVPEKHSIGYMGDGFYRSKDPTNSIKLLKEHIPVVHRQIKHTISRQ